MADNEDDSGSSRTITPAEPPSSLAQANAADSTQPEDAVLPEPVAHSAEEAEGTEGVTDEQSGQRGNSSHAESGDQSGQPGHEEQAMSTAAGESSQLVDFLQTCPEEQSILVGTDLTSLGPDMSNTTIIYVQPDGSLVEGSGLTPEEQQSLLEQLTKQQVVQVSDSEAAQLLQQSQAIKSTPVQNTALNPSQLQQVISQVTKSQHQVQALQQTVKQVVQVQTSSQNNTSQQLKSAAQQVSLQSSSTIQVGQKKSEPVRIQIQALPKQEVKPRPAPQHTNQTVSQPQVTLSANGSAQIIHIQPVVGQQGQQLFLQQNLGDPPIQLLLQSPSPMVGSLLPLVHKLPAQTSSGVVSPAAHKHVSSTVPVTSTAKTPPTPTAKFASVSLIKTPANGTVTTSTKCSVKASSAAKTCDPGATPPPAAGRAPLAPTPATRDGEKEKEKGKKLKKREKKAVKVQTRSGRVSRPPKYKAKDYKFIKTEDLAESHQSDSDDYSDMSMEDEEREVGRKDDSALDDSMSLTYSHKSRSHRCQTCDKAYIGPGGLNRHYKLNPSHGEPEPSCDTPHLVSDESQSQEPTCVVAKEELNEEKAAEATSTESGPGAAGGFHGLHHRGPGRPRGRGRGRGRGRSLGPALKVSGGLIRRGGRRGRPPKLGITMATAEQQVERRRERLQELVNQCEDEELMDIVLPRLTKVLSVWEMLLAKVERAGPARSHFPDIYREFESLQAHVRQAAQDYIMAPLGGASPLEIRNIEVARCLGILDEVNRMKVLPGASPTSSLSNKTSRYMENSKMLPPSKRFKMENSVPLHQNGIERTGTSSHACRSWSISVRAVSQSPSTAFPVVNPATGENPTASVVSPSPPIPSEAKLCVSTATDSSRSTETTQAPPPVTPMEVTTGNHQGEEAPLTEAQNQIQQVKSREKSPPVSAQTPDSCSVQDVAPVCQTALDLAESCQTKELEEGQEIYIQTEGMTVQLAEPGEERIVIVNGPDGTTMHIQTPEGVPLEAVQALLGIEASDGSKAT
ncbi:uncharacterized protein znf839 isoform X2 [Dunckerocampus dactyliophorus]|uniref:uncharacterized protein znf839 isoform X2 n=1 Tax=Dunckerocampus dactyliophorus TaxID=161453 RepID=UPI0024063067|nr:uncharacterized protein znf839 isoform X2 [Dunckerocampus dactyliophorus]